MCARQTPDQPQVTKYRLDATKKPARIDIMTDGEKAHTMPGIYELAGDSLKVAHATDETVRPTSFVSKEGDNAVVVELARDKK